MITLHGIEVKVGDLVWSSFDGWDCVQSVNQNNTEYAITISGGDSFTQSGKYEFGDLLPSLFWQEYTIPPEAYIKPKDKIKKYIVLYKNIITDEYHTTSKNSQTHHATVDEFKMMMMMMSDNVEFISFIEDSMIEVEE